MKRQILKIICFLMIGILLFGCFDKVFSFKYSKCLDKFYELPDNTVDVLFIGSSHVYKGIDPSVLYEEYGIAAYNLGSASQPIWNSYYYLEEALKTQTPELIVLECYKVTGNEQYADASTTIKATSGMRFSKTYIEAIKASVEDPKERMNFYLRFPWYHARYEEINGGDFLDNYGNPHYDNFLGYIPEQRLVEEEIPQNINSIDKVEPISEKNMLYLNKMVELAKEHDIPMMFLIAPFCKTADEKQPYYNALEQYAEEKQIPLVNGNKYYDEIGLIATEDFGKGKHLLYSGAKKFTKYVGAYLDENYDLPDKRNHPDYGIWQRNVEYMKDFYTVTENFEEDD